MGIELGFNAMTEWQEDNCLILSFDFIVFSQLMHTEQHYFTVAPKLVHLNARTN